MLALGLEQARRGGRGVGGLQERATVAWQAPPSTRPLTHDQGINIRQKISQWEGRSHQGTGQDDEVKVHPPVVSRTLSKDVLGNGLYSWKGELQGKANLSKAKSLGLDFRETHGFMAVGRKSEPSSRNCSNETSTIIPEIKPLIAPLHSTPKVDATNTTDSPIERVITSNGQLKVGCILDVEVVPKPLPQSTDDHDDNMPSGNFYTSRGFWRRLEGDKLFWEKGREAYVGPQPPPKPQRTFQYRGTDDTKGHLVQWDTGTSSDNQSNTKSSGIARPPNFPPPPCPAAKTNGISRHKKNR